MKTKRESKHNDELRLNKRLKGKKELELYIHIPFCVKKCAYCDFLSAPSDRETRHRYVDALIREIHQQKATCQNYEVTTIFMGGGTPSLLEAADAARIFDALRQCFHVSEDAEITMEVNPGTVTRDRADAWKAAGVNRISIGLQSADNRELRLLGRIHTYGEFLHTWMMVRERGFARVNVDLISAIPGQTKESWERTLRTVAELAPEHISAYSLIVEEGTLFYEIYGESSHSSEINMSSLYPTLPDEDTEREIYRMTGEILAEYGYHRYEISNYAKEGCECSHNLGYWERKEYLGMGLGAASLIGEERFSNTSDLETYLAAFSDDSERQCVDPSQGDLQKIIRTSEHLSVQDQMAEFMFLGLRKIKGVTEEDFYRAFGRTLQDVYGQQIEELKGNGLLIEDGGRFFLTERGIDISNYVFTKFL